MRGCNLKRVVSISVICLLLSIFPWSVLEAQQQSQQPARYVIKGIEPVFQGKSECGPTVMTMVMNFWGLKKDKEEIKKEMFWNVKSGVSRTMMVQYARDQKFTVETDSGSTVTLDHVMAAVARNRPVIVRQWSTKERKLKSRTSWDLPHFRIVYGYDRERRVLYIQDPQRRLGAFELGFDEFMELWEVTQAQNPTTNWMMVIYR